MVAGFLKGKLAGRLALVSVADSLDELCILPFPKEQEQQLPSTLPVHLTDRAQCSSFVPPPPTCPLLPLPSLRHLSLPTLSRCFPACRMVLSHCACQELAWLSCCSSRSGLTSPGCKGTRALICGRNQGPGQGFSCLSHCRDLVPDDQVAGVTKTIMILQVITLY